MGQQVVVVSNLPRAGRIAAAAGGAGLRSTRL